MLQEWCAQDLVASLTSKQREVLDLLLEHKSSKEIARSLRISPYTVDQRIAAARQKLGVTTRGEVARAYTQLRAVCESPAYGFSQVDFGADLSQSLAQDPPTDAVFTLSDVSIMELPTPWETHSKARAGLEALDSRFGIFGRIFIIFGLSAAIAMMFLAMVAIAQTLTELL
jgi:DNA-binding CsgD family transcriptional regulator